MKKYLFIGLLIFLASNVMSQSTRPRLNNEKRPVKITTSDAAGADTITITPTAYEVIWTPTITDSVVLNISDVTKLNLNDRLLILATNTSGAGYIRFIGSQVTVAGADTSITLTSSKKCLLEFLFDGTSKYFLKSKTVQ